MTDDDHRRHSTDGVRSSPSTSSATRPPTPDRCSCATPPASTGGSGEALAAELPDRRCLALDFRGFGDSTEPDGELDWYGFADDVLAVVDHYGPRPRAGGRALQGRRRPAAGRGGSDRAPSSAWCASSRSCSRRGPRRSGATNHLAEITRHRRETFDSFDEAIERFAAKPPLGSLRRDVLEDYVRHGFFEQDDGTIRLKARREHEAMTYEMGPRHDGFARLGEVHCPVLVAHGGDGDGPAQIAPLVAEALPAGTLRSFPELGHFGPLEDPAGFAHVVRAFLDA